MSTEAQDIARGRWRELLPQLGVDPIFLRNRHGPCPICGGSDRFRFDDRDGTGSFFCNQCGAGDGYTLVCKVTGQSFRDVAKQVRAMMGLKTIARATATDTDDKVAMKRVWEAAHETSEGGPLPIYLTRRLGVVWRSNSIRESSELWHPFAKSKYPAMVSKIANLEGKVANLHLTYLTNDGFKAPIEKAKLIMAGKLPDGCAVRLGPPQPTMGIAEGIESAMSASLLHNDMTVWAATNGTMLTKWQPPTGVTNVVIFGDNDRSYTGHARAYALANRLAINGFGVTVMIPPKPDTDWNDVLLGI